MSTSTTIFLDSRKTVQPTLPAVSESVARDTLVLGDTAPGVQDKAIASYQVTFLLFCNSKYWVCRATVLSLYVYVHRPNV